MIAMNFRSNFSFIQYLENFQRSSFHMFGETHNKLQNHLTRYCLSSTFVWAHQNKMKFVRFINLKKNDLKSLFVICV